jgi:hypothetical protein
MKFFFPKTKQAIREAFNTFINTWRASIDVARANNAVIVEHTAALIANAEAIRDQNTTITAIERNTKYLADSERGHLQRAGQPHNF